MHSWRRFPIPISSLRGPRSILCRCKSSSISVWFNIELRSPMPNSYVFRTYRGFRLHFVTPHHPITYLLVQKDQKLRIRHHIPTVSTMRRLTFRIPSPRRTRSCVRKGLTLFHTGSNASYGVTTMPFSEPPFKSIFIIALRKFHHTC
jgi:hypothetical protein